MSLSPLLVAGLEAFIAAASGCRRVASHPYCCCVFSSTPTPPTYFLLLLVVVVEAFLPLQLLLLLATGDSLETCSCFGWCFIAKPWIWWQRNVAPPYETTPPKRNWHFWCLVYGCYGKATPGTLPALTENLLASSGRDGVVSTWLIWLLFWPNVL